MSKSASQQKLSERATSGVDIHLPEVDDREMNICFSTKKTGILNGIERQTILVACKEDSRMWMLDLIFKILSVQHGHQIKLQWAFT